MAAIAPVASIAGEALLPPVIACHVAIASRAGGADVTAGGTQGAGEEVGLEGCALQARRVFSGPWRSRVGSCTTLKALRACCRVSIAASAAAVASGGPWRIGCLAHRAGQALPLAQLAAKVAWHALRTSGSAIYAIGGLTCRAGCAGGSSRSGVQARSTPCAHCGGGGLHNCRLSASSAAAAVCSRGGGGVASCRARGAAGTACDT